MRVALDLDGVLVNLTQGLLRAHGLDESRWPEVRTWEMLGECGLPTSREELWAPAGWPYFWEHLEPTPWCREICQALLCTPMVVSAPLGQHYGACCEGKRRWVQRVLGHDRLVLTDHKWLLAHPDLLLVDDSPKQFHAWRNHGGPAVLWPQPWNDARARSPQDAIREISVLQLS